MKISKNFLISRSHSGLLAVSDSDSVEYSLSPSLSLVDVVSDCRFDHILLSLKGKLPEVRGLYP